MVNLNVRNGDGAGAAREKRAMEEDEKPPVRQMQHQFMG